MSPYISAVWMSPSLNMCLSLRKQVHAVPLTVPRCKKSAAGRKQHQMSACPLNFPKVSQETEETGKRMVQMNTWIVDSCKSKHGDIDKGAYQGRSRAVKKYVPQSGGGVPRSLCCSKSEVTSVGGVIFCL